MSTPIILSSYPLSPAHAQWDPTLEAELLPALFALPGVTGLEVPWVGGLHPHDESWFLAHVPAGAQLALTAIPWVMKSCAADPSYGIASPDETGRAKALADLRRVAADVARVRAESAASVAIVTLHSAPQNAATYGQDSIDALARSLAEIGSWDWSGAQLVIEHCDAFVAGQAGEKRFLSMAAELEAIEASKAPVGMWINWGRSAIELQDADAVTAQIADAAASGHLAGVAFSGASAVSGAYGPAWLDAHLPIAETFPESESLLDAAHVSAGLAAAGDVPWLSVKVARRPDDVTVDAIVTTAERNLAVVHAAR